MQSESVSRLAKSGSQDSVKGFLDIIDKNKENDDKHLED